MAIGEPWPHIAAVNTAIAAALPTVAIDVGKTPEALPYIVIYAFDGGQVDGSLGDPDDYLEIPVMINCAADTFAQAQDLQGQVRSTMLAQSLTITGRGLFRVWLEQPGGVRLDDTLGEGPGSSVADARVFYSQDIFHVKTTPA